MVCRVLFLTRSPALAQFADALTRDETGRYEASPSFVEPGDGSPWDVAAADPFSWPAHEDLPPAPAGGALSLLILTPPALRAEALERTAGLFPGTPRFECLTPVRLAALKRELKDRAETPPPHAEGVTMHERAVLTALREAGEQGLSAQALAVKIWNDCDESAMARLRQTVYRIRKKEAPSSVVYDSVTARYRLTP